MVHFWRNDAAKTDGRSSKIAMSLLSQIKVFQVHMWSWMWNDEMGLKTQPVCQSLRSWPLSAVCSSKVCSIFFINYHHFSKDTLNAGIPKFQCRIYFQVMGKSLLLPFWFIFILLHTTSVYRNRSAFKHPGPLPRKQCFWNLSLFKYPGVLHLLRYFESILIRI